MRDLFDFTVGSVVLYDGDYWIITDFRTTDHVLCVKCFSGVARFLSLDEKVVLKTGRVKDNV